jgi:membrane protease YdiL (CAAX protease family)
MSRSVIMMGPRLQRFLTEPLVAMTIAFGVTLGAAGLTAGLLEISLRDTDPDEVYLITEAVVTVVILLAYKLVVRRLGRQKRDDLSGPGAARQTALGLGAGFLLFSFIVAVVAIAGMYRITGPGDADFLLFALVTDGIAPAVGEEILFRGILFRWLEEQFGSWPALVLSSFLFGASHLDNPGSSWFAAIGIALEGGVLLGAAYMVTRKLWLSMGIHASWNLTQGEIYDVPVSGNEAHGLVQAQLHGPDLLTGSIFGLEASIVAIAIATLCGLALLRLAVRGGTLVPAAWWRRGPAPPTAYPKK